MTVPENHVTAEGRSLKAALDEAASQLGVPLALVEHKLDLAHFRNNTGKGIGVDTVKIFAWSKNPTDVAPLMAAEAWMTGLLHAMEREAKVRVERRGSAVVVSVDAGEEGRHLVGRGGTTVRAIQHLLERSVGPQFPGIELRLDIVGGEPRRDDGDGPRPERRDDRGDRRDDRPRDDRPRFDRPRDDRPRDDRPRDDRPRDDRPRDDRPRDDRPRDDRPRDDRPRDDRPRDDRGPRGDRRDDRGPRRERRGESDDDALRRLARKIGERVKETGETEMIRRDLNAYDRRIVHLEIKEVGGLLSRSIGEGRERRIEILLADGASESAD